MKLNQYKTGLVLGVFFAIVHLVWSIFVAVIPSLTQNFIDWVLKLHHIAITFTIIQPLNILNAALLLIIAFIFGFILGWVFAYAWNLLNKK